MRDYAIEINWKSNIVNAKFKPPSADYLCELTQQKAIEIAWIYQQNKHCGEIQIFKLGEFLG